MKDYIVMMYGGRATKSTEFDSKEEAIKNADKRQSSRVGEVVVVERTGEKEEGREVYEVCYSAKWQNFIKAKYLI